MAKTHRNALRDGRRRPATRRTDLVVELAGSARRAEIGLGSWHGGTRSLHGGRLTIASEPGRGTELRAFFPERPSAVATAAGSAVRA